MAETGPTKPSRDVDDISLDDARPARKRGKGGGVLALILIILIIVVIAVIAGNQKKAAEEAKKQALIAENARLAQMDAIKKNLQAGYDLAAAGNVEGAIDKLSVADAQLGNIVSTANSEKNTDAAAQALSQKKYISDALAALQAKKLEMQTLAMDQFSAMSSQFGLTAPSATPPPTAATDTTAPAATPTPEATATPATGSEAPAATPPAPTAAPGAPGVPAPPTPVAPPAQ